MHANSKSIVVSYSLEEQAFRQETLKEYTQGNALRLLRDHAAAYSAIAIVDNADEASRAIAHFSQLQRVARGEEAPSFAPPRVRVRTTITVS